MQKKTKITPAFIWTVINQQPATTELNLGKFLVRIKNVKHS